VSLHERAAGPVEEERERHAAPRTPEPPAPVGAATLLALQRTAGNQQVARALAARRSIQRMSILKHENDGRELVAFEADEPHPGQMEYDGYEYEHAGPGGEGRTVYWRWRVSYQKSPSPETPKSPGGGPVTPSPSKYFPQQAALDYATYSVGKNTIPLTQLLEEGFTGYSRLIDAGDAESLADQVQLGVNKLASDVGEGISALGASIVSSMRSFISGGDGTSIQEERLVRQKLLKVVDDPRVIHYLLLHSRGDLGHTGISLVVSKLTAGISATVEKSGSAVTVAGLGTELGLLAKRLAEGNAKLKGDAHSASEISGISGLTPPTLIEAIGSLAMHFGDSSIVEGLKAIPFYVGTAVGLVQTAARKIGGTTEDAQRACVTIRDHAVKGEPGALKVIRLLGVPEEVALAQGGEKAMIIRL